MRDVEICGGAEKRRVEEKKERDLQSPTIADIQATREQIAPYVVETPVWQWRNREITEIVGGKRRFSSN